MFSLPGGWSPSSKKSTSRPKPLRAASGLFWSLGIAHVICGNMGNHFPWIRTAPKRPLEAEAEEVPDKAPRTNLLVGELWLLVHEQVWPAGIMVFTFFACFTHLLWDGPYGSTTTLVWQFPGPLLQKWLGLTESSSGVELQCAWLSQQEKWRETFWIQHSSCEEASSSYILYSSVHAGFPGFSHTFMSRWQDQGACNVLFLKITIGKHHAMQEKRQQWPWLSEGHQITEECHSWKRCSFTLVFRFSPFLTVHKPHGRPEDFGSKPKCKAMPRTLLSCPGSLLVESIVTCIGEFILESRHVLENSYWKAYMHWRIHIGKPTCIGVSVYGREAGLFGPSIFCTCTFLPGSGIDFLGDITTVLVKYYTPIYYWRQSRSCRKPAHPEVKAKPKAPEPLHSSSRTLPLACLAQDCQQCTLPFHLLRQGDFEWLKEPSPTCSSTSAKPCWPTKDWLRLCPYIFWHTSQLHFLHPNLLEEFWTWRCCHLHLILFLNVAWLQECWQRVAGKGVVAGGDQQMERKECREESKEEIQKERKTVGQMGKRPNAEGRYITTIGCSWNFFTIWWKRLRNRR